MLMKKIYLFIIIILAVAVVWFVKNERASTEISTEKGLEMSVSSISQTDNFYNIQVEYPQFGNIAAAFNNHVSSLITGEIVTFKKNAKDNWDARIATTPPSQTIPENPAAPFDFIVNWKPIQLNQEYLSFVINIYYFSGGAHGLDEVYAFNYDIMQKKEITINDFLGNLPQALQKLSQIAAQRVTSQLQSSGIQIDDVLTSMIQQGTKPTLDNYHNFNFNYNSLTIYFQQYQVSPGYVGPVTITIFKNTLDENSIMSDYLK